MLTALAAISFGTGILSGALGASAARESAKAKMASLSLEKNWNLGVMRRQKEDVYAKNILESYGSGISSATGSNRAIIQGNQSVLEKEIEFKRQQYDIELKNLKAQSKQKFLGIF